MVWIEITPLNMIGVGQPSTQVGFLVTGQIWGNSSVNWIYRDKSDAGQHFMWISGDKKNIEQLTIQVGFL